MDDLKTGTDELLVRVEGHVAILSFNRSERKNSLSPAIFKGFGDILPAIGARSDIRVLMITGEGSVFCAGGDVKAFSESFVEGGDSTREEAITSLQRRQAIVTAGIRALPQPVVASLPGAAVGAGFSIALAADLRIAAERAVISTAFINIAVSGDFGVSWFLPRLIGEAKTKELLFTSPRLTAREAADMGIVNFVLSDSDYEVESLNWCHRLAERAPIALRSMKANVNRAFESNLDEALDAEAQAMGETRRSSDHREGVAAFLDKRPPTFRGE